MGTVNGQIKKVEVSNDEINALGRIMYSYSLSGNKFTNEEIQKYNLENTLAYLVEFIYENKVINRPLFKLNKVVYKDGRTETAVKEFYSYPCFNVSEITNDIAFSLLKTNKWYITENPENENICYSANTFGLKFIQSNNKKWTTINLADGKIALKIYRLVEE